MVTMSRSLLFLLSSARPDGNAQALARLAAGSVPAHRQVWLDLTDPPLPPFCDLRPGHAAATDRAAEVLQAMRAASDVVLVAPVYWYALPAPAKLLMDHWSGWLDDPATGFADWAKTLTMWLVTARADPDPSVATLPEAMVRRSAEWLGMRWGGALHGVGDAAGEVLEDAAAVRAAKRFF